MRQSEGNAVREKAVRFGLTKVPCICGGTGVLVREHLAGVASDPCSCEGRGYWWQRGPDGMWMSDADVMAQAG